MTDATSAVTSPRHITTRHWTTQRCRKPPSAPPAHPQRAATVAATPEAVADVLTHCLAERPLFCDLLAHVPVSLKRGVTAKVVRDFKIDALDAVDQIAEAVHASGTPLEAEAVRDLIAVATSLVGSLWQTAHPAPTLEHLYAEDARLKAVP